MRRGCAQLREVCTERGIVLIFDEIFVGFRLAHRRRAGIFRREGRHRHLRQDARRRLSGRRGLRAQRVHEALPRRPAGRHLLCARHVQFAPLRDGGDARVPACSSSPPRSRRSIAALDAIWNGRAASAQRAPAGGRPAGADRQHVVDLDACSTRSPSRYNWMFQYYLRAEGLALSWIGTGRLIFSLNYTDADFDAVADRFVAAAKAMQRTAGGGADPAATNKSIRRAHPAGDAAPHRFVLRERALTAIAVPRRAGRRFGRGRSWQLLRRLGSLGDHAAHGAGRSARRAADRAATSSTA